MRAARALCEDGSLILLDDQKNRSLWNGTHDRRGLALIDKAMRHHAGALPDPGCHRRAACARCTSRRIPTGADRLLYGALELVQPSPGVTLTRAVAVSKCAGRRPRSI